MRLSVLGARAQGWSSMKAGPELKELPRQPNWKTWRVRDIRWGTVFSRQDYANLCGTAILIIVLAIVEFTATPRHPDYVIYDGTLLLASKRFVLA